MRRRNLTMALGSVLIVAGCHVDGACLVPPAPQLPPPCSAAHLAAIAEGPLSLEQLLEVAATTRPEVRAARAEAEAARGRMVQAGLYPNPLLGFQVSDLGDRDNQAGKAQLIVSPTVVTAGKLRLARQAAERGVSAADWRALGRWFEVRAQLRASYYEVLAARREVEVVDELGRIAAGGLEAAQKLQKAGAAGEPDVLRARFEVEQLRNRREAAFQRTEAAWRLLMTAAGLADTPPAPLVGSLDDAVPNYDYAAILSETLERSSDVQAAWAGVGEAELLLARARAEVIPNVTLALQPGYDFTEQHAGGQVQMFAAVPLCNRNQGNIQAAQAEIARTRALVHQAELRLTERAARAFQRYQTARQQSENIDQRILPAAREALRLILVGYERGDPKYDYTAVLQAQNALAQVRLSQVQVLNELQAAVSEIEGLLQRPDTSSGRHESRQPE